MVHEIISSHMWHFAFAFVELHEASASPFPLDSSPALQHVNTFSQFGVTRALFKGAFGLITLVISKYVSTLP